jgi:hypothetical protein
MSFCAISMTLVPKKDNTQRMCINCHAINNITVKYKYIILILNDMLYELDGSCVYFKINLKNRYYQIRMKEENECKTVFKIKYDLYA